MFGETLVLAVRPAINAREVAAIGQRNANAPRRWTRVGSVTCDDGKRAGHAEPDRAFATTKSSIENSHFDGETDDDFPKLGRNTIVVDWIASIRSKNPTTISAGSRWLHAGPSTRRA
jgi:hypothetical protein